MPAVEIGWRLARERWGQGYATEAAAEVLRFGFTGAGLDRIVSILDVENVRSKRVMESWGCAFRWRLRSRRPVSG
jgi:RimJ/RimL family protein N-acetyltransferase